MISVRREFHRIRWTTFQNPFLLQTRWRNKSKDHLIDCFQILTQGGDVRWNEEEGASVHSVLFLHHTPAKPCQPQGEPSDLWEPHGGLWDPYMHPWEQHGGPGNLAYPREPHWWTAKEASHEMHTLATGYNSDWVQLAGTTGNSLQKPFHTFCNTIISFWHLI